MENNKTEVSNEDSGRLKSSERRRKALSRALALIEGPEAGNAELQNAYKALFNFPKNQFKNKPSVSMLSTKASDVLTKLEQVLWDIEQRSVSTGVADASLGAFVKDYGLTGVLIERLHDTLDTDPAADAQALHENVPDSNAESSFKIQALVKAVIRKRDSAYNKLFFVFGDDELRPHPILAEPSEKINAIANRIQDSANPINDAEARQFRDFLSGAESALSERITFIDEYLIPLGRRIVALQEKGVGDKETYVKWKKDLSIAFRGFMNKGHVPGVAHALERVDQDILELEKKVITPVSVNEHAGDSGGNESEEALRRVEEVTSLVKEIRIFQKSIGRSKHVKIGDIAEWKDWPGKLNKLEKQLNAFRDSSDALERGALIQEIVSQHDSLAKIVEILRNKQLEAPMYGPEKPRAPVSHGDDEQPALPPNGNEDLGVGAGKQDFATDVADALENFGSGGATAVGIEEEISKDSKQAGSPYRANNGEAQEDTSPKPNSVEHLDLEYLSGRIKDLGLELSLGENADVEMKNAIGEAERLLGLHDDLIKLAATHAIDVRSLPEEVRGDLRKLRTAIDALRGVCNHAKDILREQDESQHSERLRILQDMTVASQSVQEQHTALRLSILAHAQTSSDESPTHDPVAERYHALERLLHAQDSFEGIGEAVKNHPGVLDDTFDVDYINGWVVRKKQGSALFAEFNKAPVLKEAIERVWFTQEFEPFFKKLAVDNVEGGGVERYHIGDAVQVPAQGEHDEAHAWVSGKIIKKDRGYFLLDAGEHVVLCSAQQLHTWQEGNQAEVDPRIEAFEKSLERTAPEPPTAPSAEGLTPAQITTLLRAELEKAHLGGWFGGKGIESSVWKTMGRMPVAGFVENTSVDAGRGEQAEEVLPKAASVYGISVKEVKQMIALIQQSGHASVPYGDHTIESYLKEALRRRRGGDVVLTPDMRTEDDIAKVSRAIRRPDGGRSTDGGDRKSKTPFSKRNTAIGAALVAAGAGYMAYNAQDSATNPVGDSNSEQKFTYVAEQAAVEAAIETMVSAKDNVAVVVEEQVNILALSHAAEVALETSTPDSVQITDAEYQSAAKKLLDELGRYEAKDVTDLQKSYVAQILAGIVNGNPEVATVASAKVQEDLSSRSDHADMGEQGEQKPQINQEQLDVALQQVAVHEHDTLWGLLNNALETQPAFAELGEKGLLGAPSEKESVLGTVIEGISEQALKDAHFTRDSRGVLTVDHIEAGQTLDLSKLIDVKNLEKIIARVRASGGDEITSTSVDTQRVVVDTNSPGHTAEPSVVEATPESGRIAETPIVSVESPVTSELAELRPEPRPLHANEVVSKPASSHSTISSASEIKSEVGAEGNTVADASLEPISDSREVAPVAYQESVGARSISDMLKELYAVRPDLDPDYQPIRGLTGDPVIKTQLLKGLDVVLKNAQARLERDGTNETKIGYTKISVKNELDTLLKEQPKRQQEVGVALLAEKIQNMGSSGAPRLVQEILVEKIAKILDDTGPQVAHTAQ